MPQKLAKKEHVEFGGRNQYDWDTYFKLTSKVNDKGDIVAAEPAEATHSDQWRFVKGDDFDITVESFRNTVCTASRSKRFGLKASTQIEYKLDDKGNQVLAPALDADGKAMKGEDGKPVMEPVAIALVICVRKPTAEEVAAAAAAAKTKAAAKPA